MRTKNLIMTIICLLIAGVVISCSFGRLSGEQKTTFTVKKIWRVGG